MLSKGRGLVTRRRLAAAGLAAAAVLVVAVVALALRGGRGDRSPIGSCPTVRARVVSVTPERLSVGDEARLIVRRPPAAWGLEWLLARCVGHRWEQIGILVAGPVEQWDPPPDRRKPTFFVGPDAEGVVIQDIGFGGDAMMRFRLPALAPGRYRLTQEFVHGGSGPIEERIEPHHAEFEIEDRL